MIGRVVNLAALFMTHTKKIRIRLFDDQVRGSFFVEELHLRGE